jgi:hypothetical protein
LNLWSLLFLSSYNISVFDMLKNKGLDITTSIVLCFLILKLFLVLDKLGDKGRDKNSITEPRDNFLSSA